MKERLKIWSVYTIDGRFIQHIPANTASQAAASIYRVFNIPKVVPLRVVPSNIPLPALKTPSGSMFKAQQIFRGLFG